MDNNKSLFPPPIPEDFFHTFDFHAFPDFNRTTDNIIILLLIFFLLIALLGLIIVLKNKSTLTIKKRSFIILSSSMPFFILIIYSVYYYFLTLANPNDPFNQQEHFPESCLEAGSSFACHEYYDGQDKNIVKYCNTLYAYADAHKLPVKTLPDMKIVGNLVEKEGYNITNLTISDRNDSNLRISKCLDPKDGGFHF